MSEMGAGTGLVDGGEVVSTELTEANAIEKRLAGYREIMGRETSDMIRAVRTVQALNIAKKFIKAHAKTLAELQGLPIGFLTDKKDNERYTPEELEPALTEALVLGIPFVGGCLMVMKKRAYCCVPGWEHRFRAEKEMGWPEIHLGEIDHVEEARWVDLPKEKWYQNNGNWVKQRSVPGIARVEAWGLVKYGHVEHRVEFLDHRAKEGLDERIIIKVNRDMTDDAVIGKARARVYKALWRQAKGVGLDSGDEGDAPGGDDDRTVPPSGPVTVTVEATRDNPTTASAAASSTGTDSSVPTEGSFRQLSARAQQCRTLKDLNELWAKYSFTGEDLQRATQLHELHKRRIRESEAATTTATKEA